MFCLVSDKQTLFTAATAGNGDNFTKLAEALASGGAMDHDTAYVEAVGSLHTLGGLQYLGLELPEIAMARFFVIKPTMTKPACKPRVGRVPQG